MNIDDEVVVKEKKQIPKPYTPFMIYVIDFLYCYTCNTCMNNAIDTIEYIFYGKSRYE